MGEEELKHGKNLRHYIGQANSAVKLRLANSESEKNCHIIFFQRDQRRTLLAKAKSLPIYRFDTTTDHLSKLMKMTAKDVREFTASLFFKEALWYNFHEVLHCACKNLSSSPHSIPFASLLVQELMYCKYKSLLAYDLMHF